MPTTLPTGLKIYNATPHELIFGDDSWEEGVIVAPSDHPINVYTQNKEIAWDKLYTLVTVEFCERNDGRELIAKIKEEMPDVLIVGSIIAAQGYPGDVVAPIPYYNGRSKKSPRIMRPDKFTIFQQENN